MFPRNLTLSERILRMLLALLAGWIALYAFQNVFARAIAGAAALWMCVEAAIGSCPLHAAIGVKRPGDAPPADRFYPAILLGVQAVFAYIWWHAGWEKVTGTFAADLPKAFARFADGNPYPFYAAFLESFAMPNAAAFAQLVQWSQLLIGAVLGACALFLLLGRPSSRRAALLLSIAALLGGAFMNANFWLAGGWTGAAAATSNMAMFWPELLLAYAWYERLRHPALRA